MSMNLHNLPVTVTREIETPRLLFVDDYADFLTMVKLVFRKHRFEIRTESHAPTALQIAAQFQPHILVSDIGMPAMDGYQLVRRMREEGSQNPFKAIALTGYDDEEHQEKALLSGFDACLTKPIDFLHLESVIEQLLGELVIDTMPRKTLPLESSAPDAICRTIEQC